MEIFNKKKEELAKLNHQFQNDYDLGDAVRKFFNGDVEINRQLANNHDLGVFVRKFLRS